MGHALVPPRVVNAAAPIRICDNGGWTDTWFAGHGSVFNVAVSPYVEVQVTTHEMGTQVDRVVLDVENYGERYGFAPGTLPGRHPLLEAAVDQIGLSDEVSVEISIFSEAPAGCSTGTSAAATVALMGALDALTPGRLTPYELASAAHRVEVERLGVQSGVQDQLCAAFGGINYMEISPYPRASVSRLSPPEPIWWELDHRLVLVFLGRPHTSTEVHDQVIATLAGGDQSSERCLEGLRHGARDARDALLAADFEALGRAMTRNTDLQRGLHPNLVCAEAQRVIDVASAHDAVGWKVNGAGGEGGSVTVLCGSDMRAKRDLLRAVEHADPSFQIVPTSLSRHGIRVWALD